MPTTIYVVHTEAETAAAKQLELFLHPQIQKGSLRLDGPFKHDTGEREELTRVGINSADIIVLLVSARLFVECGEAVQLAMVRSRMRLAPVIPVLVSHALLNKGILDGLVTLPRNRMHSYIVEFRSQDEAWVNVAQGILAVVDDLPVRRERFRREREQQVDPSKVQMLFLAANPSDTSRLQLNLEFCRVKGRIESLGLDSRFQITDKWNVEPADLATALLFHRPQVVHISAHGKKESMITSMVLPVLRSPEYTLPDLARYAGGAFYNLRELWREVIVCDFLRTAPKLSVPVFITQGRHDRNTPPELAKRWFDALDAPKKEWIWFEESAHSPIREEKEKWNEVLRTRVLGA